jgi:hypothetical protein
MEFFFWNFKESLSYQIELNLKYDGATTFLEKELRRSSCITQHSEIHKFFLKK